MYSLLNHPDSPLRYQLYNSKPFLPFQQIHMINVDVYLDMKIQLAVVRPATVYIVTMANSSMMAMNN